jgi:hypothetical protein
MGRVTVKRGRYTGEKFCFETDEERELLENARNYFASAYLLFTVGIGRDVYRRAASATFHTIKRNLPRRSRYVSPEQFELIKTYAGLYRRGEMYDEATFQRPVL